MMRFLSRFTRRPDEARLHRISDDAYVLCQPDGRFRWTLHYLLRGSYGNYLLGAPPWNDALALLAEGMGGIARVLPFGPVLHEDAARWFRRFGCRWTSPLPPSRIEFGPVPMDALEGTAFTGLSAVDAVEAGEGYRWSFDWRRASVSAGVGAAGAGASRSLVLPVSVGGQQRDLESAVVSMEAALSGAVAGPWLERIADGQSLLCVAVDALGLVACYDDIHFERNDVEMIGPTQRRQLEALLEAQGFTRVTPHCYRHREAVVRIAEPPRTHMSEPLDGMALEPGAITFVTATQAAFEILLSPLPLDRRLAEMDRLVALLPLNLRKLQTALKRRPALVGNEDAETLLAHWRALQVDTVAYYKRRRASGLMGRPFSGREVELDAEVDVPANERGEVR